MKKKKIKQIVVSSVCFLFAIIFIAVIIAASLVTDKYSNLISKYFGHKTYEVIDEESSTADTTYYKREYTTEEERLAADAELCERIESEGIVLLRNEGNALPIATSPTNKAKVTMFGVGSRDFIYGGTGSGSVDTSVAPTLQTALESSNFSVNQTVVDFYKTGRGSEYANTTADMSGGGSYKINECPGNKFTTSVKNSFASYGDAAIVVFNRAGSESSDLPKNSANDGTRSYLELTADEESLLTMVAGSGFGKTVVIINSATPMELGFLENPAYKIDACLWVGNVGQTGMYAIGEVLNGNVNPSGALVDTYAYDTLGAPAVVNQGGFSIINTSNTKGNGYMVYAEGIYVGYKYYETRYEDTVLNDGNASGSAGVTASGATGWNYSNEVQFPFGYGLSYTQFDWSGYGVTESEDGFEISLTVKNTGEIAGKDVVQIYMQSPYTDYDKQNGIEKASVQLVGYAKTSLLAAGAEETIKVSVSKEELKTYDANGEGTYIVDGGTYYFTAADNAHDAVNNILAAKGKTVADGMDYNGRTALVSSFEVAQDMTTYSVSQATEGYEITNQFADADITAYDSSVTYLSRSDWQGTYPVTYQDGRWTAPDSVISGTEYGPTSNTYTIYDPEGEHADLEMPTQGAEQVLSLAMLMDEDYDSDAWDDLIDQMTVSDLVTLIKDGGYQTQEIISVSLPGAYNVDGPACIGTLAGITIKYDEDTFSWVCEVVLASTWNDELAKEMGEMVGEDALANSQNGQKIAGWYAPAMNIHRTAYSGRNFEYYSEDSFLSGSMGAAECKGATGKGLIVYIKHFALNDQETNRTGGLMFANEQTIREIYLKPFETSIRFGGANGVMTSMNRIGVRWSGAHKGLMTETLRNEWGFKGIAVTDQASYASFYYEDIRQGLEAGTDLWLNTDKTLWTVPLKNQAESVNYTENPLVITQMREAAKHILYTVSRSLAMNGVSSTAKLVPVTPQWKIWLIWADVACAVVAAGLVGLGVWQLVKCIKGRKASDESIVVISNGNTEK
ncbi:MAG: glycoside hydrolase family 3 C-terminal domain-containing protein [Candidatus Coproplasma sp.]